MKKAKKIGAADRYKLTAPVAKGKPQKKKGK